jgi:hypothetical protein
MLDKMYISKTPREAQLPAAGPKTHNRPAAETVWQRRIRRAEDLAAHPFTGQILTFYSRRPAFSRIFTSVSKLLRPAEADSLQPNQACRDFSPAFRRFACWLGKKLPARLAGVAHKLRNSPVDSGTDLLSKCWSNADVPADPADFIALAFLPPYADSSAPAFRSDSRATLTRSARSAP